MPKIDDFPRLRVDHVVQRRKPGPAPKPTWLRFWPKVKIMASGCWEWQSTRNNAGYGMLYKEGRYQLAHRIAYELFVGPIPEGMDLDHLCRNPACANPGHLEPVTHQENIRRGRTGEVNARRQRAKTHCKNGHEFTPENTRVYGPKNYRVCKTCAEAARARYLAKGVS